MPAKAIPNDALRGLAIDRASPMPAYAQIKGHLSDVIPEFRRHGVEAFFTDDTLADHYGVSRMTARHALSELVRDGTLYRRRGVGTFLAPPKAVETEGPVGDFFDDWLSQGHQVRVQVPEFRKAGAPERVAEALRLPAASTLLFFRRVRLVNGTPVAVDDRWAAPAVGAAITKAELLRRSIHLIVGPKLGIRIGRADVEIEAARCPRSHAALLDIDVGEPVLIRTVTPISTSGAPLWTGSSTYRADLYKYKASVRAP